jgi:hypothetical protein
MSFIGVGITENVVLSSKTGVDEKGWFGIVIKTQSKGDLFSAMDDGDGLDEAETSLKVFAPGMKDFDGAAKSSTQMAQDLNNIKNNFIDVLMTQMTSDKAKAALSANAMFAGLGITAANKEQLPSRLLNEDFVKGVHVNLCNAFVAAAKPYFDANPFRIKLTRTSKAKHFATIPKRGSFPTPWVESMQVPKTSSLLKFSKWEIDNGYDCGDAVKADEPAEEQKSKVAAMFQAPVENSEVNQFAGFEAEAIVVQDAPAATQVNPFNQ